MEDVGSSEMTAVNDSMASFKSHLPTSLRNQDRPGKKFVASVCFFHRQLTKAI